VHAGQRVRTHEVFASADAVTAPGAQSGAAGAALTNAMGR
jgi:hypothetical protein